MEITVDGARILATIIPFGLLIIAIHARSLSRRIRVVPKRFALWATVIIIVAQVVTLAVCFWAVNTGQPVGGLPGWFVLLSAAALAVQTALTFYEFVAVSQAEEEDG